MFLSLKVEFNQTFILFTYGEMGKEKESGTLLGVGTKYLLVKEIKGEFYVKVSDFTRCMDSMRKELEEENKKLKEDRDYFRQCYLDLKKLCEKEGFMLSDEEVTKMFNLDKIK